MILHSKTFPLEIFNGIQSVALVANGAIHDYPFIANLIKNYEKIIAVDGGLIHCHQMNLCPDLIIGDFDSLNPDLLSLYQHVQIEKFPIDKDETDMELALRAINNPSIQQIGVFGALEKRTDHALANLHLLCRFPHKMIIETETETLRVLTGRHLISCQPGQIVSFLPLGSFPEGVNTKGLRWELKNATLHHTFFSLSNVCLSLEFEIDIDKGNLICCLLRI